MFITNKWTSEIGDNSASIHGPFHRNRVTRKDNNIDSIEPFTCRQNLKLSLSCGQYFMERRRDNHSVQSTIDARAAAPHLRGRGNAQRPAFGANCMQPKLLCVHTFHARPSLPATRRGSAVVDAEHAFGRSFAGQFTAASDVHAKVRKSSLLQLRHF